MIEIPERPLFEAEVFEIDDDLRIKRGTVRITESRMIFNSETGFRLIHVQDIRMVKIVKDEKWGFLIAGSAMLLSSVIAYLYAILHGVRDFASAVAFLILPSAMLLSSLLLLYWWFMTRSWILVATTEFGKDIKIRCTNVSDLFEIANAIELVKMGAVRKLLRREL